MRMTLWIRHRRRSGPYSLPYFLLPENTWENLPPENQITLWNWTLWKQKCGEEKKMDPLKLLYHLMQTSALQTNTMADLGLSERSHHEVCSCSCSQTATGAPFADSKVSAGCWSPTTALSWHPCLPSASGPCSVGHICTAHWSMPAPFCRPGDQQSGELCITWTLFLSSCSFPAPNKFLSPRFLGARAHQCHHKAFPGRVLSPVG